MKLKWIFFSNEVEWGGIFFFLLFVFRLLICQQYGFILNMFRRKQIVLGIKKGDVTQGVDSSIQFDLLLKGFAAL